MQGVMALLIAQAVAGVQDVAGSRGDNHIPLLVFGLIVLFVAIVGWIAAVGYRSRRTV